MRIRTHVFGRVYFFCLFPSPKLICFCYLFTELWCNNHYFHGLLKHWAIETVSVLLLSCDKCSLGLTNVFRRKPGLNYSHSTGGQTLRNPPVGLLCSRLGPTKETLSDAHRKAPSGPRHRGCFEVAGHQPKTLIRSNWLLDTVNLQALNPSGATSQSPVHLPSPPNQCWSH